MPRRLAHLILSLLLACCMAGCKRRSADAPQQPAASNTPSDQFLSLMNAGKNHMDQGDATNAVATYRKAEAIAPNDVDVHLNLANACLLGGMAEQAIREADEVLKLEPNSAAAYFIKGSACLRLANHEEALKALENAKRIDPGETATFFQLGLARMGLRQWEEAVASFQAGINLDPNRLHSAVHYLMAQSLLRAGRQEEAEKHLAQHQVSLQEGGPAISAATFERSKFTLPRVPFQLDQPEPEGINVKFVDATAEVLGPDASNLSGPIGLADPDRNGWVTFFAIGNAGAARVFTVMSNSNGVLRRGALELPVSAERSYAKMLVADLQNDRVPDVVLLGENGSHLFRFATNGTAVDESAASGLSNLKAADGILIDLDFTGKLDLVAVTDETNDLRLYRQFGPLHFNDITSTSGIPATLRAARAVTMQDWNRDGITDLIASRKEGAPLLLEKQRGGPLIPRAPAHWVPGAVFATADFDNDLRADLAVAGNGTITICLNGGDRLEIPFTETAAELIALDHDNDGWLDLWAFGEKIRAWRNAGVSGFQDHTTRLGLDQLDLGAIGEIRFADFDKDCDSDAIVALANGGLRFLRNEGGNNNSQVKVQLYGNRSNASGIGCKVEIQTGGLRMIRTVHQLPVEIGVGKHRQLDSFLVHWFNWPQGSAEVPVDCNVPLFAMELTIQEGSCPYVYAWDGKRFRFITDILGAAPLGLPVSERRYIEADPEELVWIGNEETFPARNGALEIQITEELREVLYLDEAKLVVVDREPGTEVHSTDKLLPGKPFPTGELITLQNKHPLQRAETLSHLDVTAELLRTDGRRVSPPKLRAPQLRGLAEPHGWILDFGPLDAAKPLVLVMNGWLRFGGGMANIAASHDPSLPFPFPTLEADVAGTWKPVDVTMGAPAGKTKTIIVDLEGKLEPGTRRLRFQQAFEIHWDRIALLEKHYEAKTSLTSIAPNVADLHFRGFSAIEDLPSDWPLTPDYERVSPNWFWTITPGGWCTRYGDVSELIAARDEGLAILNAGDELTLRFETHLLPPKSPGTIREYFLYVDGWDKDSDFHVANGTTVEPLPFHGMNDQLYGREARPEFPSDALHQKYNTRWVEGKGLKQNAQL